MGKHLHNNPHQYVFKLQRTLGKPAKLNQNS